ncbi:MAG: hypothetical protein V4692_01410 [Bdellovibrionota bacterium]
MFERSKRIKLRKGLLANGCEFYYHKRPLKPRLIAEDTTPKAKSRKKIAPKLRPVPTRRVREKAKATDRAVKLGKLKT